MDEQYPDGPARAVELSNAAYIRYVVDMARQLADLAQHGGDPALAEALRRAVRDHD